MSEYHHTSAATIAPLLPCPFCGNKPAIEDRDLAGKAKTIFCAEHDCIGPSTTAASYDDAAMQWNRRAGAAQAARNSVIEECAKVAEPVGPRPCDCESGHCYCHNQGDALAVASWDADMAVANAIRKLAAQPPAAPVETEVSMARPGHYRRLPEGVRCRCIKLWMEADGSYWCCDPKSQAKEPEASGGQRMDVSPEVRVGASGAGLTTTSEHMDVTAGETAPHSSAGSDAGRQWIIDLVRDQFDATDKQDDGAEAVADAILANLPLLRAQPQEALRYAATKAVEAYRRAQSEGEVVIAMENLERALSPDEPRRSVTRPHQRGGE